MSYGVLFLMIIWQGACQEQVESATFAYTTIDGKTMGTYYRITYADKLDRELKNKIDSVLREVNFGLSTYIDSSSISIFNKAESTYPLSEKAIKDLHFKINFLASSEVYQKTSGAFDPSVMPLVNYWGFGYTEKRKINGVDSSKVDSLLQIVGLEKVVLQNQELKKENSKIELDFSGCAKGYGVDEVARFLQRMGIQNYLVDIGGEVKAKGKNAKGQYWQIGINVPDEDANLSEIQAVVPLQDRALATSGNYRNFYEVDGIKYSHTISPYTGYPERNTLLSASVFAKKCLYADAYATAFMVMGMEKAYNLASQLTDIEAYFIFGKPDGTMGVKYTTGIKSLFE